MPFTRRVKFNSAHVLAGSVLVGILVPPLSQLCRPLVFPSIFFLMLLSLMQMDLPALWLRFGADARSLALIVCWQMVLLPVAIILIHRLTPLGGEFTEIAFFTACACSIFGSAAFARLMGLDDGMTLKATLLSVLVMPITLPFLAAWVREDGFAFDYVGYGWRLIIYLLIPLALAWWYNRRPRLREAIGSHSIIRHGPVIFLSLFAIGVMDGIGVLILNKPLDMASLLALAFAIHLGQFVAGSLVFAWRGRNYALTVGLLSSYRNLGLLTAVAGDLLPAQFIVFLGIWQIPMYCMPLLLGKMGFRRMDER
ncbi:MAG: hypothetical protein DHS20C01_20850 [marine bacterium B5-7]|nr:MAG: hypothetical protein DHS20C01_20850 [marine bacterium B5-7]